LLCTDTVQYLYRAKILILSSGEKCVVEL